MKTVVISGNTVTDGALIEDVARGELLGKYLWLFPKENSFLFPAKTVEQSLLSEFSRVKSVSVSREGFETMRIAVVERKPQALWCEGFEPFLSGENSTDCYFVDESGFIFSRAPQFSRNVFVRYFGGTEATSTLASTIIPDRFAEYDFFVESLRAEKLPITDLVLLRNGDIGLYLESGVKILFDTRQNLGTVLSNIELLMEREELSLISKTPRFEYVDLRYGNKVFYKSKGVTQ